MRRTWRAAGPGRLRVLMLALALLAGCSLNPPLELDTIAPAATPVRLSSVPFFAQTEFQCGPAALAGVLGAASHRVVHQPLEQRRDQDAGHAHRDEGDAPVERGGDHPAERQPGRAADGDAE